MRDQGMGRGDDGGAEELKTENETFWGVMSLLQGIMVS